MVRQNLTFLTILVSLAIIALVAVQLFWIKNAILLKEDEFKRGVYEALFNTSEKLEKITNSNRIKTKIKLYKYGVAKRCASDTTFPLTNTDKIKVRILEEFSIDTNGVINSSIKERQYEGDSLHMIDMPMEFSDTASNYEQLKQELIEKRSEMFSNLFDNLISNNVYKDEKPLLDKTMLDSVLKGELLAKGITAHYTYTLEPIHKDSLYKSHRRRRLGFLRENANIFKINLSPNNAFSTPSFICLNFPDEKNYLIGTMWTMLSISAFIVLAVVIAFFYTINTIRRQKKYTLIKNDFISNMTHEFKTPISTIALAGEMLADDTVIKTPEKHSRYTGMIREENKRLGKLVESVLQAAVVDKIDFKMEPEDVDVHEIIRSVIEKMRLQLEQKNGKITFTPNAERSVIKADKTHLSHIITNLVDNAMKYSPRETDITISTNNVPGGVFLSVKDKGAGISKENQRRIFEQFYRVPTGNVHNIKGFGLGLSYVKAVVNKHGGQVSVESEEGKGSDFRIYLPFKEENNI